MGTYPGMKEKGARYITLMYQNGASKPATIDTVDQWISAYHCNYDVVVDPKASCRPPSGSIGLPYHVIVNPRDMTVYAIIQGAGPVVEAKVRELIAKNTSGG